MPGLALLITLVVGAPPDRLNVELPGIDRAIAANQAQRLAVCAGAVSIDRQRGEISLAGSIGPQARVFSERVESRLRAIAGQRFAIVDKATADRVSSTFLKSIQKGEDVGSQLKAMGQKEKVDALVVVSVADESLKWICSVELVGLATGKVLGSDRFVEAKSLSTVAYAGRSFEARRFSGDSLQPLELQMWGKESFAAGKDNERKQFEWLAKSSPFRKGEEKHHGIEIHVSGSLRQPLPIGTRDYVRLERGEEFFIKVWNTSGHPAQAAIYVDGVNTIGKKFESPEATPYERSWIINSMEASGRQKVGWFDPTKPKELQSIRIVKREEGIALGQSPEDAFGTVTAIFYSHGPVKADLRSPKELLSKGNPLNLAGLGSNQAVSIPFVTGQRGIILASYTLNYLTQEEIDALLKPEPPPVIDSPEPPPPPTLTQSETSLDTTVAETTSEPGETTLDSTTPPPSNANSETVLASAEKGSAVAKLVKLTKEKPNQETARPAMTAAEVITKNLQISGPNLFQLERVKKQLQIALVIDGTDSMGGELDALRKNLSSFVQGLKGKVGKECRIEIAVVVYRDKEAPSGPVKIQSQFKVDLNELQKELDSIKPETGAPNYEELIDDGVATALSGLEWAARNKDNDVTRWMILCGDAPPYAEGKPVRKHTTDSLVKLSREKGVEVYSVLVNSGAKDPEINNEELLAVAKKARPLTRNFMSTLSEKTSGQFLDLWDADKVDAMLTEKMKSIQKIDRITPEEIAAFQNQASGEFAKVSLAILPHFAFKEFSGAGARLFDAKAPEARTAIALRESLRGLPGLMVSGPTDVEEAVATVLKQSPASEKDFVKQVSRAASADFVIWGEYSEDGKQASIKTRLYKQLDGSQVAEVKKSTTDDPDGKLDLIPYAAKALMTSAAVELQKQDEDKQVVAVFASVGKDKVVGNQVVTRLSNDIRAQRSMLIGLDYLEKSLGYFKSNPAVEASSPSPGRGHLESARLSLEEALGFDSNNAYANLLLASCYFNLAAPEDGQLPPKAKEHLGLAYENRGNPLFASSPVVQEIEAEHALLSRRDVAAAIEGYKAIVQRQRDHDGKARFVLRAHWMLAGISLGDWGVRESSPNQVDLDRARLHILTIMAGWPKSPEAAFYSSCLGSGEKMVVPLGQKSLHSGF